MLAVVEKSRFALTGWKVMAELPNPVNFEAATTNITIEQAKAQFACGPDAERHVEVARQFAAAGFDRLVLQNAGPDPDGFMDFFARELAGPLRARKPGSGSRTRPSLRPTAFPGGWAALFSGPGGRWRGLVAPGGGGTRRRRAR